MSTPMLNTGKRIAALIAVLALAPVCFAPPVARSARLPAPRPVPPPPRIYESTYNHHAQYANLLRNDQSFRNQSARSLSDMHKLTSPERLKQLGFAQMHGDNDDWRSSPHRLGIDAVLATLDRLEKEAAQDNPKIEIVDDRILFVPRTNPTWLNRDIYSRGGGMSSLTTMLDGNALIWDLGLPSAESKKQVLDRLLWRRTKNAGLIVTHPHSDHFKVRTYAEFLAHWKPIERLPLEHVMFTHPDGAAPENPIGTTFSIETVALPSAGTDLLRVRSRDETRKVTLLRRNRPSGNENDRVFVGRVDAGPITSLRCSDITPRALAELFKMDADSPFPCFTPAAVLYWPHHCWVPSEGRETTVMTELLTRVKPQFVIIHNRHPTQSRENIKEIRQFIRSRLGESMMILSTDELKADILILSQNAETQPREASRLPENA